MNTFRPPYKFLNKVNIPYGFLKKLTVLYIIIWSISPPLSIDMEYRLIALGCAGIFMALQLAETMKFHKICLWGLLFAVIVAFIAYMERGNVSGVLRQITIYMMVICFVINYCYQGRWYQLAGIVPIVLLLFAVYNFKTWEFLLDDPTVARTLVRNDESTYTYLRQGIGGYGLIYPQVCIFPAILAWVLRARKYNTLYFIIGITWLISYASCVMKAGYSIAIFSSVVGILIFLFYKGKNIVGVFLVAIAIFGGTLLLIIYVAPLRYLLLDIFEGTAVTKKIHDLMSTSMSGEAEGSFYVRMVHYGKSLQMMFQYPFVGCLWFDNGGGHSSILDTFAKYGVLGGYMYSKMVYYVPNDYKKKTKHPLIWSISNGSLMTLLFVSILDSFSYSFACMVLLVLPLLYEDIIRWEKIKI